MKSRKREVAALVLMLIHDVLLGFWGFLLLIMPEQVLGVSSWSFLNRSWSSVRLADSRIADFVGSYMRFWGLEGLLLAAVVTTLTLIPFRKGELWSWVCIAACSSIGWIAAVVLDIQLGLLSLIYVDVVPLIIAYCGLAVVANVVFGDMGRHKGTEAAAAASIVESRSSPRLVDRGRP